MFRLLPRAVRVLLALVLAAPFAVAAQSAPTFSSAQLDQMTGADRAVSRLAAVAGADGVDLSGRRGRGGRVVEGATRT